MRPSDILPLIAGVCFAVGATLLMFYKSGGSRSKLSLTHVGIGLVVISLWYMGFRDINIGLKRFLNVQPTMLDNFIGFCVVVFGFCAWRFKRYSQEYYGWAEILFAVASGIIVSRDMELKGEYLAHASTLVGCVYIMSRGLGNIEDGIERGKKVRLLENTS